jgi:hypothetical protein
MTYSVVARDRSPVVAERSVSTSCSLRRLGDGGEASRVRHPALGRDAEPPVLKSSSGGISERRSEHGLLVRGVPDAMPRRPASEAARSSGRRQTTGGGAPHSGRRLL